MYQTGLDSWKSPFKIKIDPDSVEALTKNKPIKLKEARIRVAFESNVIFMWLN